jgi:hypothetical protein
MEILMFMSGHIFQTFKDISLGIRPSSLEEEEARSKDARQLNV